MTRHTRSGVLWRRRWPALLLAALLGQIGAPAVASDADLHEQARQRHQTGLELARQGHHDEAVQLIQEILKSLQQQQYPGLRTAYLLEQMAQGHEALGAYPEAVLLYQQALDRNTALGADGRELVRLRNKLATLHTLRGDHDLALELLQQEQRQYQQLGAAEHADMAALLNNIAAAQAARHTLAARAAGATADADRAVIALLEQAYRIAAQALGERHPDTQAIRYNLVAAELIAGQQPLSMLEAPGAGPGPVAAAPVDPAVCRLPEEPELLSSVGPERLPTLLNNMGLQHWRQGNRPQAERYLRRATLLRQQQRGEWHPSTETGRNNLAACYEASGQTERSQMLYAPAGSAAYSLAATTPAAAADTAGCTDPVALLEAARPAGR